MIRWFNRNPLIGKLIVGAWAFFATAATLVLGVGAYLNEAALDRLDAREKLDDFMVKTRDEYYLRCIEETESLRPTWQTRINVLTDLAKVDATKPPYNLPCKKYSSPTAPVITGMSVYSSQSSPKYSDWPTFIAMRDKKSTLWVGDVPFEINVNNVDWTTSKKIYDEMLAAIKKCEGREQSKAENSFMRVTCFYDLDKDNNIMLYSFEGKIKN